MARDYFLGVLVTRIGCGIDSAGEGEISRNVEKVRSGMVVVSTA